MKFGQSWVLLFSIRISLYGACRLNIYMPRHACWRVLVLWQIMSEDVGTFEVKAVDWKLGLLML